MGLEEILDIDELPAGKSPRLINVKVKSNKDFVTFVPLGDIHYGSKDCDKKLLKETLEWLEERDDVYVLGMGDYIENATRDSVSDVFSQTASPQAQVYDIVNLLTPIAKQGKLIGLLRGNHEFRTYKQTGFEPTTLMAKLLNVPYLGDSQLIKMRVNNNNYHFYATHGSSGATTPGGKINALFRMAKVADADIFLMGHMHELISWTRPQLYIDNRNKQVIEGGKYFVCTGHFLKYIDSYAQRKQYEIGKKGVARIKLGTKKKEIYVSA